MKSVLIKILLLTLPATSFAQDQTATISGNSKFAFNLYGQLRTEKQNENLFFSPFSISTALAMTYAGAKNETRNEMQKVLHLRTGDEFIHTDFSALLKKMTFKQKNIQLNIANSLWAQKGFPFLDVYFRLLKQNYNSAPEYTDFVNETNREKSRLKINSWVENKTNNKIKSLIKPGILKANTRLVLVNAIYFLGKWDNPFDKKLTKKGLFYASPEEKNQADFMNATLPLKYFEDTLCQVVEIPYKGNKMSMVVFLPKSKNGVADLENKMEFGRYSEMLNSLASQKVELSLPKFTTTCDFLLNKSLADLGMADAFDDQKADFSGMTGNKDLFIGKVIHKAFIEVSEEGTEAAAATAVIMETKSIMQKNKIFRADHPFLFVIKDSENGSILFMGKITSPGLK